MNGRSRQESSSVGTIDEPVTGDDILLKALTTVQQFLQFFLTSLLKQWANSHLAEKHGPNFQCSMENIVQLISSGATLIRLINALHGTPMPLFTEEPQTSVERIRNAEIAVSMLEEFKLPRSVLDHQSIALGTQSYVVELLWQLAFNFQIGNHIAHADATGETALRIWCQENLPVQYKTVDLSNPESWRDGKAFCHLIDKFRPALIDEDEIANMTRLQALTAAFTCAEERLELDPFLDEEDIASLNGPATDSERRAITLFLSDLFHLFSGTDQIVLESGLSRTASSPGTALSPAAAAARMNWAQPKTLAGREDLLVEWSSTTAPLYHLETTVDADIAPPVKLNFTRFMEEMLERPWPRGRFRTLHVFEANSYEVREDKLTRNVFICEEVDGGLIALVGFSSEEHGSRAAPSERNRSYLQYLANSCLEQSDNRRRSPTVAEAALVCYARWLELTYRSSYLHIWVDPPDSSYPEYIFRNSSKNISVAWIDRDKTAERQKLMRAYQHIFDEWDFQSYVWRPEIPLPPSFQKDFKSIDQLEDGVNVRRELAGLVETARQLSLRLNKYFEERTLVVYLSEVTVLARDPADSEHLLTQRDEDMEYVIEVEVEDETLLCNSPMPDDLLSWGLIHNPELSFWRQENRFQESTARILELVQNHMQSGELMDRYTHQRAAGIVEAPDE